MNLLLDTHVVFLTLVTRDSHVKAYPIPILDA